MASYIERPILSPTPHVIGASIARTFLYLVSIFCHCTHLQSTYCPALSVSCAILLLVQQEPEFLHQPKCWYSALLYQSSTVHLRLQEETMKMLLRSNRSSPSKQCTCLSCPLVIHQLNWKHTKPCWSGAVSRYQPGPVYMQFFTAPKPISNWSLFKIKLFPYWRCICIKGLK